MPERYAQAFGEAADAALWPRRGRPLTVGLAVGRLANADAAVPHCGVRDYARCLASALRDVGVEADLIAPVDWELRNGMDFIRALRANQRDILHLQYPSLGHRYSLLPHSLGLVGVARRTLVTIHEHSALPRSQRSASQLFRATMDQVIFTTQFEAAAFGAAGRTVIPIGSNVPVHPETLPRDETVLYFGQIRPGKGLEAFLSLALLSAKAGEPWRFLVIGSTPTRWSSYRDTLRSQSSPSVAWADDVPFATVARMMTRATAAVLPFPDGAGLRRGSLLAALSNGLPVIAPFGPATTPELQTVLRPAATPEAALAELRILRGQPELARRVGEAGRRLVQRFGWSAIAQAHVGLYDSVLYADANRLYRRDLTRSPQEQ